jgi:ribosomal protein L11 methyltransferase
VPSFLSHQDAGQLSGCLALYSQTASSIRDLDSDLPHDDRDWVLRWVVDTALTPELCQNHIEICAREFGISNDSLQNLSWDIQAVDTDTNWLEESYRAFPPFTIEPFFIYGSHCEDAPPDDLMGLQIDAATAFGSGEHGTTAGCLRAMVKLKDQGVCPLNILDMGTGSGILAIAAWKLWQAPVLAVDNDAQAVHVCERHAAANRVTLGKASLSAVCGDGFVTPQVQSTAPYELVIANILAGPLIGMAKDLCASVDDRGFVILSGILNEQAQRVSQAYTAQGLEQRKLSVIGEWTTLTFQKS